MPPVPWRGLAHVDLQRLLPEPRCDLTTIPGLFADVNTACPDYVEQVCLPACALNMPPKSCMPSSEKMTVMRNMSTVSNCIFSKE